MATRITVKSVTMPRDNDGVVRVEFNNGCRMVFAEHFVPMKAPTNRLERVWIEKNEKTLVLFHSKHQYPINYKPFGFISTTEGWTVRRVIMYWQAALRHVNAAHAEGRLTRAWRVMSMGRTDLREIQQSEWPMPAPTPPPSPRTDTSSRFISPADWHQRRRG